jgi:hypothetical protein
MKPEARSFWAGAFAATCGILAGLVFLYAVGMRLVTCL